VKRQELHSKFAAASDATPQKDTLLDSDAKLFDVELDGINGLGANASA